MEQFKPIKLIGLEKKKKISNSSGQLEPPKMIIPRAVTMNSASMKAACPLDPAHAFSWPDSISVVTILYRAIVTSLRHGLI